ncbi:MAG: hypothetical protein HYX78_10615 [Armatimonadetes bacterium]|nr:hypothetical protein [Armatimonadota bacterium]
MSEQVSLAIIAICMIVIALAIVVTAAALTVLALRIRKSVVTITNRTQPLISQATDTVKVANDAVNTVKARTDEIMTTAEDTVQDVSRRVKTMSNIVQESISPPIINVASVVTGVSKGLEVLAQMRRRGGNGHGR